MAMVIQRETHSGPIFFFTTASSFRKLALLYATIDSQSIKSAKKENRIYLIADRAYLWLKHYTSTTSRTSDTCSCVENLVVSNKLLQKQLKINKI